MAVCVVVAAVADADFAVADVDFAVSSVDFVVVEAADFAVVD